MFKTSGNTIPLVRIRLKTKKPQPVPIWDGLRFR